MRPDDGDFEDPQDQGAGIVGLQPEAIVPPTPPTTASPPFRGLARRRRCLEFRVKYTVSRLSDAEAALVNPSENLQREDPRPVQLAHAIRSLTEDQG